MKEDNFNKENNAEDFLDLAQKKLNNGELEGALEDCSNAMISSTVVVVGSGLFLLKEEDSP